MASVNRAGPLPEGVRNLPASLGLRPNRLCKFIARRGITRNRDKEVALFLSKTRAVIWNFMTDVVTDPSFSITVQSLVF